MKEQQRFWNPYYAGVALGLVLLASYLLMAHGLGASGAAKRLGESALLALSPDHVRSSPYLSETSRGGKNPLDDWLVFEVLGVFFGGAVSATLAGRFAPGIIKGPRARTSTRLVFAFAGGLMMGIAARFARGCTSGQALTGGALLSVGSWVFMLSVFAGGYAVAYFLRRQWI